MGANKALGRGKQNCIVSNNTAVKGNKRLDRQVLKTSGHTRFLRSVLLIAS